MKVLHVIPSVSPRTGGPANVMGLLRALADQGCDVTLFTTDLDQPARGWLRPPRRLVVSTDRQRWDGGVGVRYFRTTWPWRFATSWGMGLALAREVPHYDLVHIHSLYLFPGLAAGFCCRRAGVPYIMRPHGTLDAWHRRQRRRRKAVYTWLAEGRNLRFAAGIHYTSQWEAEAARAGGVETPGFVVGMGIDRVQYEQLPEPGRFRLCHAGLVDKKLIVFLGRISPKKGFDLLVPALQRVVRLCPDAHLVIAGPDDEGYAAAVHQLIRQYGVGQHVTWIGPVYGAEKLELLRDADVWVLPSRDENFGVAVVEAMAAGAAILISNHVAIHDVIQEARAGVVVETDVGAVADALERLLADGELRQCLGERARVLALQEWTWDVAARSLLEVYQSILSGRGCLQNSTTTRW